ncbi:MAG: hypothetical protein SVU69_11130 [Pseudomonadota bacterium]|nr:hypothetical protein [Pseudomonadota bacterium]
MALRCSTNYDISISGNGNYIICRVDVPITKEIARDYSLDVDRLSREKNIKRFLFDLRRAPNIESTFDNYDYAYEDMPDMRLQRDVRSAVLVSPDDHSHDFPETVMRNAGYNVRLFTDLEAAVVWLEE